MTDAAGPQPARKPRQLLLAFFGEFVCDRDVRAPVRTSVLIQTLESAGVAPSAVRTNLDRMVHTGLLVRRRLGREVGFELTGHGTAVLRTASARVHGAAPFDPQGEGWTLVSFSVPEQLRDQRHRLRAALTWSGFGVLRDGLWIAPGVVALADVTGAILPELPPGSVNAFSATEVDGFPMSEVVRVAWDIAGIRAAHEAFLERWAPDDAMAGMPPVTARTVLVADWLALLRVDPRLPRAYMDPDWPAGDSLTLFRRLRRREDIATAGELLAG